MNPEPLVSVVTPLYNTEKYIGECIESVLAQTYQNWEYVIVNNFSKDRSLEIAEEHAARDPRIRVLSNEEFLNAIPNWNHAIRQISPESKYCKVVHADDWLYPECIERMVSLAETNPSVGLVSAYRLNEDQVDLDGLPHTAPVIAGRDIRCRSLMSAAVSVFGSPTSVLYRADLVRGRDPFYPESSIHADTEACYEMLKDTDFGFVHQVLSYTRRHNEALTSFVHRFSTRMIGRWTCLIRYGPEFLSNEDYRKRFAERSRNYHRFLARNLFELRESAFWDFHKKTRAELGIPYSRAQMVRPILREFAHRLLRPRQLFRPIVRFLRKGQDVESQQAMKALESVAEKKPVTVPDDGE